MALFKNRHTVTKLTAGALISLAAAAVFLLYVPPRPDIAFFYGLDLIIVWYPLTALLYGAAVMLACRRDYAFAAIMGVIFLAVAVLNTVIRDFVELPAAFVYTVIAVASAALTWLIIKLCKCIARSYRLYKEKRTGSDKE